MTAANPNAQASAETQHTVLVADSNLNRAERLAEACRDLGLEASTAVNGALALEVALAEAPDLIVSELDLPLVTGRKLAEILRANPRTHAVRFVFLGPETSSHPQMEVGDTLVSISSPREEVLRIVNEQLTRCDRVAALENASQSGETVSGDLAKLPLADLLQVAHLSRKSGRVELEREGDGESLALEGEETQREGERGHVVVRDGDVLSAETEEVEGEKALFRMLAWREGRFRFAARRDPDAPVKITAPVRALLTEGLRQIAEWDRLALQLPPLSATVKLSVQTRELPHIVHPLTQEVLLLLEHYDRVRDIVDRCSYPDYQVLRTLQTLAQRNMVAVGQQPVRGLEPRDPNVGLFSDAQLRRLRDHLENATPRGGRTVAGKLLIVPAAQGVLADWLNLLRSIPQFEPSAGLGRGATPRDELAPLGLLRLEADLELELVQLPGDDAYQPLRAFAGHGALGTFHLHSTSVSELEAARASEIDGQTRVAGQHVVLLSRKQKLDPATLQENLTALDDASLFLIPLARDPMDREPSELLRNLLARIVP